MKEELVSLFSQNFKIGNVYNHQEIRTLLEKNEVAILKNVAAYSYNRWNKGMSEPLPFFEWQGRDSYLFLGENYPYTGEVYHHPQGGKVKKIGFWESGKYSFSNPSMKSFKEWKNNEHKDNFETDVCYIDSKIDFIALDGSISQKVMLKDEVVQNDFTDNYKHIIYKSALGQKLFFKSINDEFDFGSQKYKITNIS